MSDPPAGLEWSVALEREVDLLDRRVRAWTGRSWAVTVRTGATRAELVASLAAYLDELGRGAGVPVPPGTGLPRVADHALADQVIVLAGELVAAVRDGPGPAGPDPAAHVTGRELDALAERAAAAVRDTRLALGR